MDSKVQPRLSDKKNRNILALVIIVAALVLLIVAGVLYYLMVNAPDDTKADKKIAAPVKIMTSLKSADDSTKAVHEAHTDAADALNEEQVRLSK